MKAFLLTLVITLTLQLANSQDYIGLPESGRKWVNAYMHVTGFPDPWPQVQNSVSFCSAGVDTLINEIDYTQIDECDTGSYKGAFRNAEGRVYFVPADSLSEFILYDFTLNVGDTVFNVYCEPCGCEPCGIVPFVVCAQTDSIAVADGSYRRTVRVADYLDGSNSGGQWIEGIGNSQGLFQEYYGSISEYFWELACFRQNDTIVYSYSWAGCPPLVSASNQLPNHTEWNVFPNPSSSVFYISTAVGSEPLSVGQFRVYDTSGRLMDVTPEKEGNRVKINLQGFPAGIYWLQVELYGQFSGKRIVKI